MSKGFGNIMRQAQQMQKRIMELQEEVANKTVTSSVGGGMVTVVVNGKHELISIKIDPEVVKAEEIDMLEDLIVAGVNDALRKVQDLISDEMSKITGGLKIPGLL